MLEIALASQSPRRRELLSEAGYFFRVYPVKVSEIFDENLNPEEQASHLATVKAQAAFSEHKALNSPGYLVLGADTIVALGDQQFAKPENSGEAHSLLRLLSGKTHRVITGFSLWESGAAKFYTGFDQTLVRFRDLSDQEIAEYVASGEPMDKAGGYAIQGGGKKFVSSVQGSWSNVVGLPMERLARALEENGWNVRRRIT
ncbi:MAG: septum formation protein Maf [Bdellovibrionaceae bacterium]|nr:septum formation protein Maf [Pseudobdellovibrionaceae bacterium]